MAAAALGSGVVGVVGSRVGFVSPAPFVASLVAAGRPVAVGCCVGADAVGLSAAVAAGAASSVSVFSAFGPGGSGACGSSSVRGVWAAAAAGASVRWWCGGVSSVPLRGRLAGRSRALVGSVAAAGGSVLVFPGSACPAGLVPSASASACWAGRGSGSWAAAAFAAGSGAALVVVPGRLPLPVWPGGSWVRCASGGLWRSAWRWAPAPAPVAAPLPG